MDLSKIFKNAVLNLYKNGTYTVDYAIIEVSRLADKNKINATDYEELITYLAEEQEKSMKENEEANIKIEETEEKEQTEITESAEEATFLEETQEEEL